MNQDELIEKCRLTDKEIAVYHRQASHIAIEFASATEGNFRQEDIDAIYDDSEKAMLEAQLRKAIPIIEAEARKAERKRIFTEIQNRGLGTLGSIYLPADVWKALKGGD